MTTPSDPPDPPDPTSTGPDDPDPRTADGPGSGRRAVVRWRMYLAGAFCAAVVAVQIGFALNGYREPHKLFAFQPFDESSTWRADVVRVTWDGRRLPIGAGWDGYDWDELVAMGALRNPGRLRHASRGIDSTLAYLDEALDWVAAHTPDDHRTRYLEADVTYYRNTRGPHHVVLRSGERPRP
jgi:hypothetical protein